MVEWSMCIAVFLNWHVILHIIYWDWTDLFGSNQCKWVYFRPINHSSRFHKCWNLYQARKLHCFQKPLNDLVCVIAVGTVCVHSSHETYKILDSSIFLYAFHYTYPVNLLNILGTYSDHQVNLILFLIDLQFPLFVHECNVKICQISVQLLLWELNMS